jgi:hypothetical protein
MPCLIDDNGMRMMSQNRSHHWPVIHLWVNVSGDDDETGWE